MNKLQREHMLVQLTLMIGGYPEAESDLYCMSEAFCAKTTASYLQDCKRHCLLPDLTVLRQMIHSDFKNSN